MLLNVVQLTMLTDTPLRDLPKIPISTLVK
jgi:hypothetical protein